MLRKYIKKTTKNINQVGIKVNIKITNQKGEELIVMNYENILNDLNIKILI